MNKIKITPILAAVMFFILSWTGYPAAALLFSWLNGITFAAAAAMPYMIGFFSLASIFLGYWMYNITKKSAMN